jgi:hypothetical protein
MSAAFSVVARWHHHLLLALSPNYRQIRERLEAIGRPSG